MPVNTVKIILTALLLSCLQMAYSQSDVSVSVSVDNPTPEANELVYATIGVTNEGVDAREGLEVELRFSNALFFVNLIGTANFREQDLRWLLPALAPGASDSIRVAIQPNYGGVHTLTAELMVADKADWDSTPGNGRAAEDDQKEACISVPVAVECGQELVLSAPRGRAGYSWYRNGVLLANSTGDTIHPIRSGAYEYQIEGEACSAGNCCPVIVDRTACDQDLALRLTVAATDQDDPNLQETTITILNQGSGTVSKVSYYVNGSRKMRLAQGNDGWLLKDGQLKRDWVGMLHAGDSVKIRFDMLTLPDGVPSDYVMFAEIEGFYAGTDELIDVDSTPDDDPTNDAISDNAVDAPREIDEDDSDIANLTNCPLVELEAPEAVCAGELVTLQPVVTGTPVSYEWSSTAALSCTSCESPSLTVNGSTEVTLITRTDDGCEQSLTVTLETKTCVEALELVVSPYHPSQTCFEIAAGQELEWCSSDHGAGVNIGDSQSAGTACITGETAGEWAGAPSMCLKLCENGDCSTIDLTVTVLPKLDRFDVTTAQPVCINGALQTDAPVLDVTVSDGEAGLQLIPAGGGCFKLLEPVGSYPAQTFEIVHTYSLNGKPVYDTTLVDAAERTLCDLTVFASDTVYVDALTATQQTGPDAMLCLEGSLPVLRALELQLDNELLETPQDPCGEYHFTLFDFRTLPRNYDEGGWRLRRYYLDGQSVASNRMFGSLSALFDYLKSFDPGVQITLKPDERVLHMDSYTRRPTTLQITHLATNALMGGQGLPRQFPLGAQLNLPAGLPLGAYSLSATDEQGCVDETVLIVRPVTEMQVFRDTVLVAVQAGDPVAACELGGADTDDSRWQAFASDCKVYFPEQANVTEYHTFARETATERYETIYQVAVTDRACESLMVDNTLSETPANCRYANFNLGLLYPGMSVSSSTGTISQLASVTGSVEGAVFTLSSLQANGMTARYQVVSFAGLPEANGVTGSLVDIVADWRDNGVNVYADWLTGKLCVVGSGLGGLRLRELNSGQNINLMPSSNAINTYGRFGGRRGTSRLTVRKGNCPQTMTATVECGIVIIFGEGGTFGFDFNSSPRIDPRQFDLPVGFVEWEIIDAPSTMTARKSDDGDYLEVTADDVGSDEIVLQACDANGECRKVKVSLTASSATCSFDIWQPEQAKLLADRNTGEATLILPEAYQASASTLVVNGERYDDRVLTTETFDELTYSEQDLAGFSAFATPFGKTVPVDTDAKSALQQVLAQAQTSSTAEGVVARSVTGQATIYGRDVNDIWQPMRPRTSAPRSANAIALTPGSYTIEVTSADGQCTDHLAVEVIWPPVRKENALVELTTGEAGEYCLPEAMEGGLVSAITDHCSDQNGERVSAELIGNCLDLMAYEAGVETVCLVRQYVDGSIDSITIDLQVRDAVELVTKSDHDTVEFGQFHVLEVLANDVLADEPRQLSLISEPYFGRAQVVGNNAIEYLHNGSDCAVDVFTYEVCQGDVCDSATVQVTVFCDELLVYNGFSPNGDGVNDELTILGLGQYPNHTLQLFNREGILLMSFTDYTNDWRGDIGGQPLPSGTYFYVIDLGDGQQESGYIQLSR